MTRGGALRSAVLQTLIRRGGATRPELIAATGARAGTLLAAVDRLKDAGLIREPGRHSRATGRTAPRLELNPGAMSLAGVELRPSGCFGVIIDGAGEVIASESVTVPEPFNSAGEADRAVSALLQKLLVLPGKTAARVRGVGFADPGVVDTVGGESLRSVNIPGWRNLPTARNLQLISDLPVTLFPEALARAYAEYAVRGGNISGLFHLSTTDGIGGGFIYQGGLFTGHSHRAMEIGHLPVAPDGPRCRCGNYGCLEAMISPGALRRRLRVERLRGAVIPELPDNFTVAQFAANIDKSPVVREVNDELCRYLAIALGMAVMLLNPEYIVISGELTQLGTALTGGLRRELTGRCFPEALRPLKIELSTLSQFAAARGAALIARDRLLLSEG